MSDIYIYIFIYTLGNIKHVFPNRVLGRERTMLKKLEYIFLYKLNLDFNFHLLNVLISLKAYSAYCFAITTIYLMETLWERSEVWTWKYATSPNIQNSQRELLDIPVVHVQCTTKPWVNSSILGNGFRYLLMFTPILGGRFPFWLMFQPGWTTN